MKRFLNWLHRQKKETVAATVTLLVIVIAGAVVLLNASRLQNIFDPEKFARFGNRQEGEGYDSVAGDGLESDLADRDRDGNSREDKNEQKAVKIEGVKPQNLVKGDEDEGIGRTTEDSGTPGNTEQNPDAYEITDEGGSSIDNGGTGGGNTGNGGTGVSDTGNEDTGNGDAGSEDAGIGGAGDGNTGTGGTDSESPSGNGGDSEKNPGTQGGPGGNEGDTPSDPEPKPDTDPVLSESEQNQLKPRDPIITEAGELLSLSAEVNEDQKGRIFCVGDTFDDSWVKVTAVFRQDNGSYQEQVLAYGGTDGYSVSFPTVKPGSNTAIFRYRGLTATAGYEVLNSVARIRYYAESGGNVYMTAAFPGLVESLVDAGDTAQLEKIKEMGEDGENLYASSGSVIDLTEYHRWLIAYLGDEKIRQVFAGSDDVNFRSVTFLEEGKPYLTTMLGGFRYFSSSDSQTDDGRYLYYPVSADWGTTARSLADVVVLVPEGYGIRRVVSEGTGNLPEYKGDQVLEQYVGTDSVPDVPMGVTKIDFDCTNEQKNTAVTALRIPESVYGINAKSVAEYLPNLTAYSLGPDASGQNGLKVIDGILYSADGKTLLSVPPGMTEIKWAPGVTDIAANAFWNSQITDLAIPETVVRFEKDCFAGFRSGNGVKIHMAGETAPKPKTAEDTGFTGTILTKTSAYDAVQKDWMFAFADDRITFGKESETGAAETGKYQYDKAKDVIVYGDYPDMLAGIPSNMSGNYTVPGGITSVGAGAFASCKNLYDIVFPESLQKLERDSLILPANVESLTFTGNTAARVDANVFGDPETGKVPDLTVYVPDDLYLSCLKSWKETLDPVYGAGTAEKLLRRGSGRFFYENGARYEKISEDPDTYRLLKLYDPACVSFAVKDGTVQVAESAFADLAALEIVYLPDSVTEAAKNAFSGCASLQTVAGGAESLALSAQDLAAESGAAKARVYRTGENDQQFFYGDNREVYVQAPDGTYTLLDVPSDHTGVFTLRENTVSLNQEAFAGCAQLTGVTGAEASLISIGDSCFENCAKLVTLDLTTYTKCEKLGSYVFRSCGSLEELSLPDGIADTGTGMCYDCRSLIRFHAKGLQILGEEAFAYCTRIPTMDNPNVTKFGARAYMGCSAIRTMELPDTLTEMGEECFRDCVSLASIGLNGTLTAISRYAFAGCRNLAEVNLSAQQKGALRVIGVQAFAGCSSLESADFRGCSALQQMGEEVFSGCGYLTRVTLPMSLRSLPDRCFADCGYLSILELQSTTVPDLGSQVFGNVISPYLHLWVQPSAVETYRQAYEELIDQGYGNGTTGKILGAIDPQKEIIRGITYQIEDGARILAEVDPVVSGEVTVLQDTVRIADEAFKNCAQVTAVELPDGSTVSLGDRCFSGCSGLREVRLYGNIPAWGTETFRGCAAIEKVELGNGSSDRIVSVGDRAFMECTGIAGTAAVTFRAQIDSLGAECFSGCSNMGTPAMTSDFRQNLQQIGDRAFAECRSLSVFLNREYAGLKTIGAYAFTDCDSMVGPAVPEGVTDIGEGCFAECDNLTTVSFYCGLEEYPKDCFRNCPKLDRTGGMPIAFQSLKRIGEGAYAGCSSLQMPASGSWQLGRYTNLEEIGPDAFAGCAAITQATVPATVKTIGANAFAGCAGLQKLEFTSDTPPEIAAGALDNTGNLTRIEVPAGTGSAYREKLASVLSEEQMSKITISEPPQETEQSILEETAAKTVKSETEQAEEEK